MRKYLLLTFLLLNVASLLLAQNREINGTISDATSKSPLVGVSIQSSDKGPATQSKADGSFKLTLPAGKVTLTISYVGYQKQTVTVGPSTSTVSISLEASDAGMDEVVVTALGIKRDRQSLGYATATIKGEELTKAGTPLNPALALYGKAPGVGINIGSAGPTGGVNIRIRGAGGMQLDARSRPLFVVDGVPIYDQATTMANVSFDPVNSVDYGTGINDLNSDDVESIEILKGAKATILYGSQGLNGVVLITTKSGKRTRGMGMQVSHQISVDKPFSYIDFQNEYGTGGETLGTLDTATTLLSNGRRVRIMKGSRYSFGPKFDGSSVLRYDSAIVPYQAYPNNFIDFFKNGITNRTNVAIAGGGEFGSARASFSHVDFTDLLPGSYQKSNTFSFNGNFNVSPFANFEFINNLYSIKTKNRRSSLEQVVAFGLNRDFDYNEIKDFYIDENGYQRFLGDYTLPLPPIVTTLSSTLWDQEHNSDIDAKIHNITSIKATLKFSKAISFIGQASLDYTNTDYTTENQIVRLLPQLTGGKYQWRKKNSTVQNYQALVNYDKSFLQDDLRIFAFVGGAYQQLRYNDVFAGTGGSGLRFPGWFSLNNELASGPVQDRSKLRGLTRGSELTYGVFGSVTASWKNKLFFELQSRNDWNSTLTPGSNSYFYPGMSLTYNFSEDITVPKLQFGKLRLSWANVGGGPSTVIETKYFADQSASVGSIYEGASIVGVTPSTSLFLGNIKPFRKREIEIGFNTRWFEKSRVEVDFSFYRNNIYDQIIQLDIDPASGYSDLKTNTGNTQNWGYELMIKGTPVISKNFRWDLTFTGAQQLSKVIDLNGGLKQQTLGSVNNSFLVLAKKGERQGDIYAYDFARDPSGNKIVNAGGNYSLDNSKYVNVGNVNPKLYGGLYSDFFLKGFNFHVGLDYRYGGKSFSYTNNYLIGNGVTKATLAYRDESKGGLAYYINGSNKKIPWQHNSPAPPGAAGGLVYHDGIILDGVMAVDQGGGNIKYEKNTNIISAPGYYQSYIQDGGGGWPPDRISKNDYVKIREASIDYTIPKSVSDLLRIQKLTISLAVRNLGYIYKSIPNIDAESTLGAQGFIENSFYPSLRTYTFGVNLSF